jgi:23S rRNA (guanosine2251-2'-O)-methyltransferase
VSAGLAPSSTIGEIRKRAEGASVPVRVVARDEVDRVAGGTNHQGVVALAGRFRYTPLERILARPSPRVLFLDGVMDPGNLGSLLRSADGAGFDGVVVRARRAAGVTAAVRRVSAGAAEVVAVARVPNMGHALGQAAEAGLWLVGMDERAGESLWASDMLEPPVGIVLGAEDKGMSTAVRDRCDVMVRIPVTGRIGSLNVAVAGAIALFEVARRAHQE